MSDFTPGPWIEEPAMSSSKHVRDILQAGGNIVLAMVGGEIQSEAIANARLIAAAPELLEALQNIESNLSGPDCFPERVKDSLARAEAAIAKATT